MTKAEREAIDALSDMSHVTVTGDHTAEPMYTKWHRLEAARVALMAERKKWVVKQDISRWLITREGRTCLVVSEIGRYDDLERIVDILNKVDP